MRVALVLALLVTVIAAPLAVAEAGQRRAQAVETDRAFSGPGWRYRDVENFREQFFRDQQRFRPDQRTIVVAPSVVVVSPGRCWQDGYWSWWSATPATAATSHAGNALALVGEAAVIVLVVAAVVLVVLRRRSTVQERE